MENIDNGHKEKFNKIYLILSKIIKKNDYMIDKNQNCIRIFNKFNEKFIRINMGENPIFIFNLYGQIFENVTDYNFTLRLLRFIYKKIIIFHYHYYYSSERKLIKSYNLLKLYLLGNYVKYNMDIKYCPKWNIFREYIKLNL